MLGLGPHSFSQPWHGLQLQNRLISLSWWEILALLLLLENTHDFHKNRPWRNKTWHEMKSYTACPEGWTIKCHIHFRKSGGPKKHSHLAIHTVYVDPVSKLPNIRFWMACWDWSPILFRNPDMACSCRTFWFLCLDGRSWHCCSYCENTHDFHKNRPWRNKTWHEMKSYTACPEGWTIMPNPLQEVRGSKKAFAFGNS